MLDKFQTLVNNVKATTKRTEKEALLKQYINDSEVKYLLNFVYNPYITTGISTKKLDTLPKTFSDTSFSDITMLLQYLSVNNTGRNQDLLEISKFIARHYKYEDLIKQIISKDLTLGIQSTTLNKVFGKDFIPTFDVMLGYKYFDDPDKLLPDGVDFILTTKLDGVRGICVRENGNTTFYTRSGQIIYGMVDLANEASNLPDNFVYDGELLLDSKVKLKSKDLYRETVKVVNSDRIKDNLIFNVFDFIDIDCFKKGYDSKPCSMRKSTLSKILARRSLKHITDVDVLYEGTDKKKIIEYLDFITSNDGEGVMINISDAPWEAKRTKNLLKVKKMQTMDLRCIDMEIGTGVNSDRLGAIVVELPIQDNIFRVKVGSGFTFEDRKYYWEKRDEIIGKIVEIQYFEQTNNSKDGISLRFPVFKCVRFDKNIESIN